jgi:hypothetical protein
MLSCVLWVTFTTLYFVMESKAQDKSVKPSNQKDISSNLWFVNGKSILIYQNSDLASKVVGILSPESIVLGELPPSDGFLRVSYPGTGWIDMKKDNLIRVEVVLGNPDLSLNANDPCSGIVSLSPASANLDQMLSWQNQWPIGNGKFGTFVGGSYSVNIMPFSMEGFYVGPIRPEGSKGRDSRDAFRESRVHLLKGEFEKSQQLLSSAIREQPMSMFQSVFDLVLLFTPDRPDITARPSVAAEWEGPTVRSRKELLADLQTALFDESLPFKDGVLSQTDTRLLYERNVLKTRAGVSTSSHLLSNADGNSVSSFHSRTWFASSVDDVIVGKFDCLSTLPNEGGCLNFVLHLTRDKRTPHPGNIFRTSSWAQRNDYSSSGFQGFPVNADDLPLTR